jgi:3D (Asp-Asp-Asp) domain-containing protein/septal ring factor EnvC (AmiA/AmiB activator)
VRLWYRPALVRRLARLQARLLVIALFFAICGVVGAASGADTSNVSAERVGALRHENATLTERIDGATLNLYALDSKLHAVRTELTAVNVQRARLAREQLSLRLQLNASRHNLRTSQRQLALLVHALYEQQANDPLAVMLGAQSLEQALATLDDLGRAAQQNAQIAARSREAQRSYRALRSALAGKAARIRLLEAAASRKAASLEAAMGSHQQYVSTLVARRHLNLAQVARIEARAHSSAAASNEIAVKTIAPSPSSLTTPAPGNRTITVVATGYSSGGTTATGLPVGWGTVAVDPSVIPLGSQLTIPGYGRGVAADTGSAVRGATVDLWFPTMRQALAWGRRVVIVTLH